MDQSLDILKIFLQLKSLPCHTCQYDQKNTTSKSLNPFNSSSERRVDNNTITSHSVILKDSIDSALIEAIEVQKDPSSSDMMVIPFFQQKRFYHK